MYPMPMYPKPMFSEPISPELVLVSPELAAIARAGLPDRPWEQFLPPVGAVTPLRPPAIAEPPAGAEPESAGASVASQHPSRRRPRVPVGAILLVAFVGLVVAGSVLPERDAPTLGPPPARANGLSVPSATPPTPTTPTTPASPATPATTPTTPVSRTTRPTTTPTAPTKPTAPTPRTVHPRPAPLSPKVKVVRRAPVSGGYVLARGFGRLRVGADARSILELNVDIGCRGEVVLRRVGISPAGRFSVRRVVRRPVRTTVSVTGVFTLAGRVHGTMRVTTPGCASGPIVFTGRLS